MPSHQVIFYGFPHVFFFSSCDLRFRGTGQVKECQGFMKHFKPEALGRQMRDALEMKHVSLPLPSSESWPVLSHTDEPSIFHSFPSPLFARLGSYPYVKKNGAFSLQLAGGRFGMNESIRLIVKK